MSAGMAVGAASSAAGGILSAQSKANALGMQADIQQRNAYYAQQQAEMDANRQQIQSGQKIGEITAGYGASGVSANSGSVMDVLFASHMNAELDRQKILYGGQLKSINYQNQASMDRLGQSSLQQSELFDAAGGLARGIGAGVGNSTYASSGSGTNIEDYGDSVVP